MLGRDQWGGAFEITGDHENDDDRSAELDRSGASAGTGSGLGVRRHRMDLDETQQSWLLGPQETKKKKKYVDLGCVVISAHLFKWIVISIFACGLAAALIAVIVKFYPRRSPTPDPPDSYTVALPKALTFFNIQKSGKLPKNNNVTWRGDSGLQDGLSDPATKKNLVGGYYDAGDQIKFTYTTAYAMTLLSWSVIEYSAKYRAIGELGHVRELIRWGNDYMLKTFNASAPRIDMISCMVGSAAVNSTKPDDHYCWMRPEDMDYSRPVTECRVGSDLGAEMAASMAAASIVFKDDPAYSRQLVNASSKLFAFARDAGKRGRYSKNSLELARFYNSTSYYDDYVWGATWLYLATGNSSYLQLATNRQIAVHANAFAGSLSYGVFSWDNKLPGAQVLLSRIRMFLGPGYPYEDMLSTYHNQTGIMLCSYLPVFNVFNRTRGGLIELNYWQPQPLQYAANAAFLATLYSDYLDTVNIPGWYCGPNYFPKNRLRRFAKSQIDYILGKNPKNMSYVVGYGNKYPRHAHHRAASIPKDGKKYSCTGGWQWRDTTKPNPHILTGAMVGGPDRYDGFQDVRTNFNYTEPTIAGNAGLVGALVALANINDIKGVDKNTMFSSVPPLFPPSPPPPKAWVP